MKKLKNPIISLSIILFTFISCKKNEIVESSQTSDVAVVTKELENSTSNEKKVAQDEVSLAASQEVKDRKFVKTADVKMEVKDVYESSIFIEKKLQELDGFVTSSNLNARIISENTYQTSDENAMLVRKYQTENKMQVRIPTENLGSFLTFINDKKVFLNSRIISAEDVTNNAKIAELEKNKLAQTKTVIDKMKNEEEKVNLTQQNLNDNQYEDLAKIALADNLKYSTVDIYIQEPTIRVAEIAVTNTKGIDQKYRMNFLYDIKNALQQGFYLIQSLIVGLFTIWPFILILSAGIYFWRKRKTIKFKVENTKTEEKV